MTDTGSNEFAWSSVRTVWDDVPWADADAPPSPSPSIEELRGRWSGSDVLIQVSSGGRTQIFDHDGHLLAGKVYFKETVEFRASGTADDVHDHLWHGSIAQGTV